ncbi:hypothetical protein G6F24_017217 [Rhizopus arrhizus]|nr:hypothetical protein G6F24_017217 [Rhizopus arrhizus]
MLHRGGQLFHAGRGFFQRRSLALGVRGQVLVAVGNLRGGVQRAFNAIVHVARDADQAFAHDFQRELQGADLIAQAGRGQGRAEVARGDLPREVGGGRQQP